MRLLFLQHDPLDGPGALLEWADKRGHIVTTCLVSNGISFPLLDSFDLLVSLGGPMGAYEEEKYPWLIQEKQYLKEAVLAGKKIVGLCLGCQLLAAALGGEAYRHTCKEFGWQPIDLTEEGKKWFSIGQDEELTETSYRPLAQHTEGSFRAFQWHGDTYSLPPGAVKLASNAAAEQQAFIIGDQVLALQFHLEWTEEMMRDALAEPNVAPPPSPFVQTPEEILREIVLCASGKKRFFALMDKFAG
jgi:GMP synthase (glutamine-hydrolysing)